VIRSAADQFQEATLMASHQIDQTRRHGSPTQIGSPRAVRQAGAGVALRALHWLAGRRGPVSSQRKADVTTLPLAEHRPTERRQEPLRQLATDLGTATRVAPVIPDPAPAPSASPLPSASGEPPRIRRWNTPGATLLLGALLAAILVVTALLPGDLRATKLGTRAQATATPRPTATATALPTAGALPGFAIYADPKTEFTLQYPATWTAAPKDAGVEFYTTDAQVTEYVVDVLPEGGASTSGTPNDPTEASQWVNLALQGVQQQESVQNFLRMTGPLPAVTIGGQTWQSGAAVFDVAQLHSRVQVYATLYQGKPYVITLLAPDASFAAGDQLYFKTMLTTFQFVSTTPSS
jgi:hypothetical protein